MVRSKIENIYMKKKKLSRTHAAYQCPQLKLWIILSLMCKTVFEFHWKKYLYLISLYLISLETDDWLSLLKEAWQQWEALGISGKNDLQNRNSICRCRRCRPPYTHPVVVLRWWWREPRSQSVSPSSSQSESFTGLHWLIHQSVFRTLASANLISSDLGWQEAGLPDNTNSFITGKRSGVVGGKGVSSFGRPSLTSSRSLSLTLLCLQPRSLG